MTDILNDTNEDAHEIGTLVDFEAISQHTLSVLQSDIKTLLNNATLPAPLSDASKYVMMAGGKRVRPLLVSSSYHTVQSKRSTFANETFTNDAFADETAINKTNETLNKSILGLNEACRRSMLSVELLHAYSLVHDDLPCMDDDDLRRGQPTCHIKFGEATALLTGDVLQTLAFEALMPELIGFQPLSNEQSALLLSAFAPRARRMVIGQMLDLNAENMTVTQSELESIHKDKTGALIEASVLMGGIAAGATVEQLNALQQFARDIGLAFQVQDDILDVIKSTDDLGKPAGSDEKLDKSTYVKLMGVETANDYAKSLFDSGKHALSQAFGADNALIVLADWLWNRHS